jgi:hypothetical protein
MRAEAGVPHPAGREGLTREEQLVDALIGLARERPGLGRAVVKLNQGFGGEGNGVFTYPASRQDRGAIREALESVQWTYPGETTGAFLRKLEGMGGVAEELITGDDIRSPSVQMRIAPDSQPQQVSSHEQLLGGATGQTYLGCRFPAEDAYRSLLMREAAKIGDVLSSKGVIGRFAIDFLVHRDGTGGWQAHAIEINLRMGGTTPPFYALEFLTGGRLDPDTGNFYSLEGEAKYYTATDNLSGPDGSRALHRSQRNSSRTDSTATCSPRFMEGRPTPTCRIRAGRPRARPFGPETVSERRPESAGQELRPY